MRYFGRRTARGADDQRTSRQARSGSHYAARPCIRCGDHSDWTSRTGRLDLDGSIPVVIALAISIVRDLLAGRMGVDVIALLAMSEAIGLNQSLAAIVVAIMYTGGTLLEDYAVGRAERNLKLLVDRAPRLAHRRADELVEDVAVNDVKIGDVILVRAGEVSPVDGLITSQVAVIDESALTGEPIPVTRRAGENARRRSTQATRLN